MSNDTPQDLWSKCYTQCKNTIASLTMLVVTNITDNLQAVRADEGGIRYKVEV